MFPKSFPPFDILFIIDKTWNTKKKKRRILVKIMFLSIYCEHFRERYNVLHDTFYSFRSVYVHLTFQNISVFAFISCTLFMEMEGHEKWEMTKKIIWMTKVTLYVKHLILLHASACEWYGGLLSWSPPSQHHNQALILYIFHISASHYTLYRKLETTPKNNSANYRILFRHVYWR